MRYPTRSCRLIAQFVHSSGEARLFESPLHAPAVDFDDHSVCVLCAARGWLVIKVWSSPLGYQSTGVESASHLSLSSHFIENCSVGASSAGQAPLNGPFLPELQVAIEKMNIQGGMEWTLTGGKRKMQ